MLSNCVPAPPSNQSVSPAAAQSELQNFLERQTSKWRRTSHFTKGHVSSSRFFPPGFPSLFPLLRIGFALNSFFRSRSIFQRRHCASRAHPSILCARIHRRKRPASTSGTPAGLTVAGWNSCHLSRVWSILTAPKLHSPCPSARRFPIGLALKNTRIAPGFSRQPLKRGFFWALAGTARHRPLASGWRPIVCRGRLLGKPGKEVSRVLFTEPENGLARCDLCWYHPVSVSSDGGPPSDS